MDKEHKDLKNPLLMSLLECNNRELLSKEDLLKDHQAQEDSQEQEVDHHQAAHRIEVHHQVIHRIEDHHQAIQEGHLQEVHLITCLEIQTHFHSEIILR